MKRKFDLPKDVMILEPPATLEKRLYAQAVSHELGFPFVYYGGLFLMEYSKHMERFSSEFGQILDGGNFLNEAYSSSLLANWGNTNSHSERYRDLAGEWVAFEKGLLLSGIFSEIGPIPFDSFYNYSFMVKPVSDRLWRILKRDGVMIIRFNFPGIAPNNIDDLSIKLVANSPSIRNLSKILDAVGIQYKK